MKRKDKFKLPTGTKLAAVVLLCMACLALGLNIGASFKECKTSYITYNSTVTRMGDNTINVAWRDAKPTYSLFVANNEYIYKIPIECLGEQQDEIVCPCAKNTEHPCKMKCVTCKGVKE